MGQKEQFDILTLSKQMINWIISDTLQHLEQFN